MMKYKGEFKLGKLDGKGTLSSPTFTIKGTFKQGKTHGAVELTYKNGDCYNGHL